MGRLRWFGLMAALVGLALAVPAGQSPQTLPLITSADFTYEGAFRVPTSSGPGGVTGDLNSFNGGGENPALSPDRLGLYLAGSRCCTDPADAGPSTIAEILIPEIRTASTISGLATATYRQVHADALNSQQRNIGCGGPIGGILPLADRLLISVYCYYDANSTQIRSHWRRLGLSLTGGSLTGPVEVQSPTSGGGRAGFVSGYMTTIPAEWQSLLGGNALTGNCCIPIITRTSWGPAISVFNTGNVGTQEPVPATALIGYTNENHAQSTCTEGQASSFYTCATTVNGVIFPAGTRSVLFFGSHGTGLFCYGPGTSDQSRHLQPDGEGGHWCYDPAAGSKGNHAYPYQHYVWAYDANDLLAVKNGTRQMWQLVPYARWTFNTPFSGQRRAVGGATYDPVSKRVYITFPEQDAPRPLVHVFNLGVGTPQPPPPPPPPDGDGDGVPDAVDACPAVAGTGPDGCPVAPPPPSSDTEPPSLTVTDPLEGAVLPLGGYEIRATASDNVGIVGVRFDVDGLLIEDDTSAPLYDGAWPNVTQGAHVIRVTARDAAGNTTVVIRNVSGGTATPQPPPPPPPPGAPFLVTAQVTQCRYTATDSPPTAQIGWGVQFRQNTPTGTSLGSRDTTAPYTRSSLLTYLPSRTFYAIWTRTGSATVVRSTVVTGCQQ